MRTLLVLFLSFFAAGCGAPSDDDSPYLPPAGGGAPPSVPVMCAPTQLRFLDGDACPSKLVCDYPGQRCYCVGDVPRCGSVS